MVDSILTHEKLELEHYLEKSRKEIEDFLISCLDQKNPYANPLLEAMRYSILGGGKRLRAILAITSCRSLQGEDSNVFPVAAALELIHGYSLIHDDLPALDNDDYRRGKLSTHKKYGEAMGILAGDGLLTHAFWITSAKTRDKEIVASLVETLSYLSGIGGMVVGQVADILNENKTPSVDLVDFIHKNKTGALIAASCKCGAIAAKTSDENIARLTSYGEKIGLAFQIMDDLLDVQGTNEGIGKRVKKDEEKGKVTYPAVWGVEKSEQIANQLVQEAQEQVSSFPNNQYLLALADYVYLRKN